MAWKSAFLIAFTAAVAGPALAQDGSQAKAERLVGLVRTEQKLEAVMAASAPAYGNLVVSQVQTNPQTASMVNELLTRLPGGRDRLVGILAEEYLKEMRKSFPKLRAALATQYRARFTDGEMDEMIRFFSSGAGAKLVAMEPQMQTTMAEAGREAGTVAGMAAARTALDRARAEAAGK